MRTIVLTVVVTSLLLSTGGAVRLSAAEGVDQQALWSNLQSAGTGSNGRYPGRRYAIEGIRLIKQTDGVSRLAAALATVLQYDNGGRFIIGDDETGAVLERRRKAAGMKERDWENVRKRFGRHITALNEEYEKAKKGRKQFLSPGVDFSRMVEPYVRRSHGDLVAAMKAFGSRRAYETEVVVRKDPPAASVADSLSKGKPLILRQEGSDAYLVCIGFLERDGIPYVVAADPATVEFKEVSNAELIRGTGAMAQRLREASKGFDQRFGPAKLDRIFEVSGELPAGVAMIPWSGKGYVSYSIAFTVTDQSVDRIFSPGFGRFLPWGN